MVIFKCDYCYNEQTDGNKLHRISIENDKYHTCTDRHCATVDLCEDCYNKVKDKFVNVLLEGISVCLYRNNGEK